MFTLKQALIHAIKQLFAPYKMSDSYGSSDYYFTLAQAIADMVNCSPVVVIGTRWNRKVILQRIQGGK